MTEDQSTVLRVAALRRFADDELDKAGRCSENAREHILDALSALRQAVNLEGERHER